MDEILDERLSPQAPPMPTPVMRSVDVTLVPGGVSAIGRPESLKNPFRAGMWLDEIRFLLTSEEQYLDASYGLLIDAKFDLGRNPLTNQYVPIAMLGKLLNPNPDPGSFAAPAVFTWHMPKPFYVPANNLVMPNFRFTQRVNLAPETAVNVRLTYVGRSLEPSAPEPDVIHVPWATPFIGQRRDTVFGVPQHFVEDSTHADLCNSFNGDLHLQRFIGRILRSQAGFEQTEFPAEDVGVFSQEAITVRITNADARITVKDGTPFGHLFDIQDRAWTVNTLLRSKGFYLAHIDERLPASPSERFPVSVQPFISMIGWRDVEYRP